MGVAASWWVEEMYGMTGGMATDRDCRSWHGAVISDG